MIEFKSYTGEETLKEEGFQVFETEGFKTMATNAERNLDRVSKLVEHADVFRTKLGDIKQIQNLTVPFHSYFTFFNTLCAQLVKAEDYKILNNQYFCKPPNYKMTSAHQDNAYFESDEEVYTFWMPLQDVDVLNSCMFYVPGSHKNGLVHHDPIGTNTRIRTGAKGVSLYSDVYLNKDFVKVPMKVGQVLVHDKNCMHFSSPNLSDNYRMAITCIMKILK